MVEEYVVGELLTKRNIKEYFNLGLTTDLFVDFRNKLIFNDLITNEKISNIEICEAHNLDIKYLEMLINTYNKTVYKLTKVECIENMRNELKRKNITEYFYSFQEQLNYASIDTLKKFTEQISSMFDADFTGKKNSVITTDNLLLEIDNNSFFIENPYKILREYFKFSKGQLITIGSRTSMGKTALCLDLAVKLSENYRVTYVNLEMTRYDLITRLLANISDIPLSELKEKKTRNSQNYLNGVEKFKKLNLNILDCENNNYDTIISDLNKIHNKEKQDVVMIDYLTLLKKENTFSPNRNIEIEEIVNNLKLVAKQLNVCIIIVSQLSRAIETREDKTPQLSDLRDSGGVEQASDVVLLLYREDYYSKDKNIKEKDKVIMQISIAKNRQGKTGVTGLGYIKSNQKFLGGK